jgi:hypothetical protein
MAAFINHSINSKQGKPIMKTQTTKLSKKLTIHKESILLLQSAGQPQGQGYVSAGCKDTNDC